MKESSISMLGMNVQEITKKIAKIKEDQVVSMVMDVSDTKE
jgi:hypothetical protein